MIFIERVAAPDVFAKKKKAIEKEILTLKAFFNGELPDKKEAKLFKFYTTQKDLYKDDLINMFRHRCAYCECIVTVGQRGDIEHFRPKGQSVTRDGKTVTPGYYWLAAAWENLYLSCINCNQNTVFRIIDSNDPTKVIEKTSGKMNQFALMDEAFRLNYDKQKLEDEEPYRLLIDPCRDKPEELLEFTEDGIVKARKENGNEHEKANYSIDVYALQREGLVRIRKQKYLDVMDRIVSVNRVLPLVVNGIKKQKNTVQHQLNREEMEKNFFKLIGMLDADNINSEYIGLARQHAEDFLQEYSNVLSKTLDPTNGQQSWFADALKYFEPQVLALKSYFEKLP